MLAVPALMRGEAKNGTVMIWSFCTPSTGIFSVPFVREAYVVFGSDRVGLLRGPHPEEHPDIVRRRNILRPHPRQSKAIYRIGAVGRGQAQRRRILILRNRPEKPIRNRRIAVQILDYLRDK